MVVSALSSTGESLMLGMKTDERSPELGAYINDVISGIKTRWEELKVKVELHWKVAKERGDKFEAFITCLTDFTNWLSEFYSTVYEEFCERIPPKASDEIITHHRTKLRVCLARIHNVHVHVCMVYMYICTYVHVHVHVYGSTGCLCVFV